MVVVIVLLLFGSETWIMTPQMEKALNGFYHRVVQRMEVMVPKCQWVGTLL